MNKTLSSIEADVMAELATAGALYEQYLELAGIGLVVGCDPYEDQQPPRTDLPLSFILHV